jgi:hypothetical protein
MQHQEQFTELENALTRKDFAEAETLADKLAEDALLAGDKQLLLRTGMQLERLRAYGRAGRLLARGGLLSVPGTLPEWDGTWGDHRLLIVQRIRHIGSVLRLAHLATVAARRVRAVTAVVERRLLELVQRSFPGVTWTDQSPADPRGAFDRMASWETLMQHCGAFGPQIRDGFRPLAPDPAAIDRCTTRYAQYPRPWIGISWASTNKRKDLPDLGVWGAALKERNGATYFSLQYGDVDEHIAAIAAAGGPHIVHDPAIDALNDIDGLAAQIAAMDAILTISNTTAHLAGALGALTYVVLDAKEHLIWPAFGDDVAWYPRTTLVRPSPEQPIALLTAINLLNAALSGAASPRS